MGTPTPTGDHGSADTLRPEEPFTVDPVPSSTHGSRRRETCFDLVSTFHTPEDGGRERTGGPVTYPWKREFTRRVTIVSLGSHRSGRDGALVRQGRESHTGVPCVCVLGTPSPP